MKTRIIIDSTADLPGELRARFTILPLTVHFGEESYEDGVTITHREFYEKLIESDVLPTTSQVPPQAFHDAFQAAVDAGEEVVAITISSKLSGTYQSAMIAAGDFPGKVWVVDSKTAAIAAGILAEHALSLAEAGMGGAQLAAELEAEREKICLVAMLDTLEYLKKGGRISAAVAFAGGLLSIKPVISLPGGEIEILGKARGSKQGNNLLVKEIGKAGGVDFEKPLLLGYTGLNDDLLRKYIADSAALWEGHMDGLRTTPIGSVIGTHAGPGAIAVAFFKK